MSPDLPQAIQAALAAAAQGYLGPFHGSTSSPLVPPQIGLPEAISDAQAQLAQGYLGPE